MRCSSAPPLALSERCRTITNAQGERMSGAHGHGHIEAEGNNRRIALLIAVLALFLALAETMAKGAQTNALSYSVEASNLWSFFQAKTVRQTVVRTAGEIADIDRARNGDEAAADAIAKRTDAWAKTVARWESEPETGEGRKELIARAKAAEEKRDTAMAVGGGVLMARRQLTPYRQGQLDGLCGVYALINAGRQHYSHEARRAWGARALPGARRR